MVSHGKIQSIYTDGACKGNPGPGGWGVVIYFADSAVHELGGAATNTTNNRMEMQAAIAALQFLASSEQREPVTLYTDSEYLKNGVTRWIAGWKKRGWKTAEGKPVLNQDLWMLLDQLNSKQVQWQYVRGHAGNIGNERCDVIASAFALGQPIVLTQIPDPQPSSPDTLTTTALETSTTETLSLSEVQSEVNLQLLPYPDSTMTDSTLPNTLDSQENIPREVRVAQLRNLIETLRIADEIASHSYLISSSELSDLMDVNASAVTSRGDNWVWRNWVVSRVRREGNQILWQLERID